MLPYRHHFRLPEVITNSRSRIRKFQFAPPPISDNQSQLWPAPLTIVLTFDKFFLSVFYAYAVHKDVFMIHRSLLDI